MALYLLNISIDTADPNPEYIAEDLSINDQESIVELVIEQVFGFEDAIKELDDHDTEEHNKSKITKIDLLAFVTPVDNPSLQHPRFKFCLAFDQNEWLQSRSKEIEDPPPKI